MGKPKATNELGGRGWPRTIIRRWAMGAALGMGVGLAACLIGAALAVADGQDIRGDLRTWLIVLAITLGIAAFVGAAVLELWLHVGDARRPVRGPWTGAIPDDDIDHRRV
jgi:hypothetical protein